MSDLIATEDKLFNSLEESFSEEKITDDVAQDLENFLNGSEKSTSDFLNVLWRLKDEIEINLE
ncbi:MAG: hypothetical protein ACI4UM_05110 [Succinivibrio sp.]